MTRHSFVLGVWGRWAPPKVCAHHWCRKRGDDACGTMPVGRQSQGQHKGAPARGPAPLPHLQPADRSFSPIAGLAGVSPGSPVYH